MLERTKTWNVRVTAEEDEMLKAIAEAKGLSVSDVLRQLVRNAAPVRVKVVFKKQKPAPVMTFPVRVVARKRGK